MDRIDAQDVKSRGIAHLSDRQGRLELDTEVSDGRSIQGMAAEVQMEEEDGDIEEDDEEDEDEEDEAAPLLPIFSAAHLGTF